MKIFSKVALMTGVAAVAFAATAEARTLRLNHNNPPDHPLQLRRHRGGSPRAQIIC